MDRIQYSDIRFARCIIDYRGDVNTKHSYGYAMGLYRGKDAYVDLGNYEFMEYLNKYISKQVKPNGQKLFVSGDSKMPRALLRGSDYKIVLNKDNADIIVLPYPREIIKRTFNMLIKNQNGLYAVTVQKQWGCPPITDTIIERVKESVIDFAGGPGQIWYKPELEDHTVYFVRKCDEYQMAMDPDNWTRTFMYDINVQFTPTTETTPENLEFLFRCKDPVIFEKALIGSEWQKYPFTTCNLMFLKNDYASRNALQIVKDGIFWDDFNCHSGYESNRDISPEDWNMCQRWLMYHYGLDEQKGGFINAEKFRSIPSSDKKALKHIVAVKPVFIEESAPAKNLMDLLK